MRSVSPGPGVAEPRGQNKVVFMFAGQGSQYPGMGRDLFATNARFREAATRMDEYVRDLSGASVLDVLFSRSSLGFGPLTRTRISHPGIVMVELALAQALISGAGPPDAVVGASLGEYAAAVVAGSMSEEDCLRLVVRQAERLDAGPGGGMLAVLAAEPEVADVVRPTGCEVAARHYDSHHVLTGSTEAISAAEALLRDHGVAAMRLPVEHGYHSSLLDPYEQRHLDDLAEVRLIPPTIPWISCVDGREVAQPDNQHLWRVLREPIDFERTVAGVGAMEEALLIDLSPSGTLAGFARRHVDVSARLMAVMNPFRHDPEAFASVRDAVVATHRPRVGRRKMKVYGFPGQGSQRKGMGGGDLFDRHSELVSVADGILGYSVREMCRDDPGGRLAQTNVTQPMLYVVEALEYLEVRDRGGEPTVLIGHSLGEFVALFAAGVFSFEDGLRLVQQRGELMLRAKGGAMAAVVGADAPAVRRMLTDRGLAEVDIANDNSPAQCVVAGSVTDIETILQIAPEFGVRAARLNVSAAFHSRYMRQAGEEFAPVVRAVDLAPPRIPVIANVDATPYPGDPAGIANRLTRQITSPVLWTQSVRSLLATDPELEFLEVGPGNVLTRLVEAIRKEHRPAPVPASESAPAGEVAPDPAFPRSGALQSASSSAAVAAPEPRRGPETFQVRYGLGSPYLLGGLAGGISGVSMLKGAQDAGLLAFLGTHDLDLTQVEEALHSAARAGVEPIGMNLTYSFGDPARQERLVDLALQSQVAAVEVGGYPVVSPELVRLRAKGVRLIVKVSRIDSALEFLAPVNSECLRELVSKGSISRAEADTVEGRPVASDLCVEGDGGWILSGGSAMTLLPGVAQLLREIVPKDERVHVGYAGGVGTPAAARAAFALGAEFVLTGSVNQSAREAETSDWVKDVLVRVHEDAFDDAPYAHLAELGVRARVLKHGSMFAARARRLRDFATLTTRVEDLEAAARAEVLERGAAAPELAPGLVLDALRAYARSSFDAARCGGARTSDYLVFSGPAIGAFNRHVKGTRLDRWQERGVADIAHVILDGAQERS